MRPGRGNSSRCFTLEAEDRPTAQRRPARGAFLTPRTLAEEPHSAQKGCVVLVPFGSEAVLEEKHDPKPVPDPWNSDPWNRGKAVPFG
jgi:hypothetical protein